MHIKYHLPKEFYQLVKRKPRQLTNKAKARLQALTAWQALRKAGYSAQRASLELGVSRATLYRWQKRLLEREKSERAGGRQPQAETIAHGQLGA